MRKNLIFSKILYSDCEQCGYPFKKECIYVKEGKPSYFSCDACYLRLNKSDMPQSLTINNKTIKLDDIFGSSWGYEQTNVSYYQVLGFKGSKTVLLREINKIKIHSNEIRFTGVAKPLKDNFRPYSKILTKRVKDYGHELIVDIDSCQSAYLLKENEFLEYSENY